MENHITCFILYLFALFEGDGPLTGFALEKDHAER